MIKKNPLYSEKGITLVELVVAMGIVSIIIIALTRMFIYSTDLFSRGEEKSHNQMQMRIVVDEITKDLRYAKNLEMLEDSQIPSGPPYSSLDQNYKYIFFKEEASDWSIVMLEYNTDVSVNDWVRQEFLKGRINLDRTSGHEKSYFELNNNSVKFDVTDKGIKHEDSRKFNLTTTVNLLNADIVDENKHKIYAPVDPNPPTPTPANPNPKPNKYRGIKYKK